MKTAMNATVMKTMMTAMKTNLNQERVKPSGKKKKLKVESKSLKNVQMMVSGATGAPCFLLEKN